MARTLGPAGRGAASAIQLWPVVIAGLVTLGIPVALRYNIRQKSDDSNELFSVAFIFSFSLGVIATIIGFLLIPHWLERYPAQIIHFAQAMMFFAPLMTVNALLQGFLEASGRFSQSSSMLYFPPVGTLLSLAILYVAHAINVYTVPLAYEIPFSCITIATIYRIRGCFKLPRKIRQRALLLLHFGARAYGLDVLNTLSAQIGQLLVVGLLSASSFGLYAVALNVSRTLFVVGTSLNTVLFPKASELEPSQAITLVTRAARMVFAANILLGGLLVLLMPILIRLAYGNAYTNDIRLAQVLTVEVVLGSTVSTLAQAFMSTGRPGLATLLQTIGLCITFPLMLVLIPRIGLMGAALALLTSTSLRLTLVLASFPIVLKHRVPRLLLNKNDMTAISIYFTKIIGQS